MKFGDTILVLGGAVELNGETPKKRNLTRRAIFLEEVEKPFNRLGLPDMAKVSFLPFGPLAVVYMENCRGGKK